MFAVARLLVLLCAIAVAVQLPVVRTADGGLGRCALHPRDLRLTLAGVTSAVWRANVSAPTLLVHPSRAYGGVWLRDSFWTVTAMGDLHLSEGMLRHFYSKERDGQLPTQFAVFLRDPVYREDESTLLFLIWSAWQVAHGGVRPPAAALSGALRYVLHHDRLGMYRSRPGTYRSWFDSFRLPRADTLAYNQGLLAVALEAATALRIPVPDGAVAAARRGYASLVDARGGYLRFSAGAPYHDISGLTGEFLSLWLFGHPLLADAAVGGTLRTQPGFRGGFKVVVGQNGGYLSPGAFAVHLFPGDYQNGGSWLLYDYLALAAGHLHHVPGMLPRMDERLRAEFAAGRTFHEYLNTDPRSPLFGHEPAYRDVFSWNSFVTRIDRVLEQRCSRGSSASA